MDLIFSNHFSRKEPGVFEPIRETLLTGGDYYMHLADLTAYVRQTSEYGPVRDPGWSSKAILNVARAGKFSSDRTIAEYATASEMQRRALFPSDE